MRGEGVRAGDWGEERAPGTCPGGGLAQVTLVGGCPGALWGRGHPGLRPFLDQHKSSVTWASHTCRDTCTQGPTDGG